jgi:hypothetical protein
MGENQEPFFLKTVCKQAVFSCPYQVAQVLTLHLDDSSPLACPVSSQVEANIIKVIQPFKLACVVIVTLEGHQPDQMFVPKLLTTGSQRSFACMTSEFLFGISGASRL